MLPLFKTYCMKVHELIYWRFVILLYVIECRWYKNGQILKPDLDSDYMITGNVLTIPNVNNRHSGMYQCAATNVHGTTMSAGQLRVLRKLALCPERMFLIYWSHHNKSITFDLYIHSSGYWLKFPHFRIFPFSTKEPSPVPYGGSLEWWHHHYM